jgi:hypothetical protein
MIMKKLTLSKLASLLLVSSSTLLSGCKTFPVVDQRTIDVVDGAVYCTICYGNPAEGQEECEVLPIEKCDKTVGYSIQHHNRIMTWGRKHCK